MLRFVESIDESYKQFDDDRMMLERSLELTSEELLEKNRKLKADLIRIIKAEEELRESKERYALALQGANDGIWDYNLKTGKLYVSERFCTISGLNDSSSIKTFDDWLALIHQDDLGRVKKTIDAHREGKISHIQTDHRIKRGKYEIWVRVRGLAVRDEKGEITRMAGSMTDITQQKDFESLLEYQALHDALTGLPNRTLLQDRLEHNLSLLQRDPEHNFAVLFIDLDRFKVINDSLGHLIGDELLSRIAERLQNTVRESDTVARLGGDEFCVLVEGLNDLASIISVTKKILSRLSTPFDLKDHEVDTSASIGIALGNAKYKKAEEMLRDADSAMYRAKADGKNRYAIFDKVMHKKMLQVLEYEKLIRSARHDEKFTLHFQPIISLRDGKIKGCETLLRLPQSQQIPIQELIHVAEDSGQIVKLGNWVFKEACLFAKRLKNEGLVGQRVSVNVSARQFQQEDLARVLLEIVKATEVDPHQLGLEITESILLGFEEKSIATIEHLRREGISFSIDDFGTGYSSLSYLNKYPVNSLKVDRSFVAGMPQNRDMNKITDAIIRLGHSLALDIIAEGVETEEQYNHLLTRGCDFAQGFHIARPVSADEYIKLCRSLKGASPTLLN